MKYLAVNYEEITYFGKFMQKPTAFSPQGSKEL